MAGYKVEICGVDTSSLPVLKNERMRELFPLVKAGDTTARNELISGNLRLVLSVIARFTRSGRVCGAGTRRAERRRSVPGRMHWVDKGH